MITPYIKINGKITSELALQLLKEGNVRFLKNKQLKRDYKREVLETSNGQSPFAIILSCMDSRVPIEIVFDEGIGDLFSISIAGNIINRDILGSMEFACKLSSAKLILVLGHTSCGAIKGACENAELGYLTELLEHLKPAINSVSNNLHIVSDSGNNDFTDKVSLKNVELTISEIKNKSGILRKMYEKKEIDIRGAMYDVRTGKVTFIPDYEAGLK